jgi:hypothetical protein
METNPGRLMQFDSIISKRSVSLAAALSLGLAAFTFTGCGDEATAPSSTGLITITSPTGGETLKVGDTLLVTWSVKNDPLAPDAVDVRISADGGTSWGWITKGSIPKDPPTTWPSFKWAVKESTLIAGVNVGLVGKDVLVRVEQYTPDSPDEISVIPKPIHITAAP